MTFLSFFRCAAFTLLSVSFLTLANCAGQNGPKYRDTAAFCNGRAKAECGAEVIKACAVVDASRCVASREAACMAATPAGMIYNADRAEPCVDAVSAAYGDARLTAQENRSTVDVCSLVFDGPGSVNAGCRTDADCRVGDGLRCVLAGGTASGTCQIPERVQGGGLCTMPRQLCIEGFHCGATLHCDINSQIGEPCNDVFLPCGATALCGPAGVCVAKLEDGTPCTRDDECLHDICARGPVTTQGLCVTQMNLAPNEPFCIDAR
ncbi:MAG: hypothetical protein ABW133_25655 [Polyangiaceae bacterium]